MKLSISPHCWVKFPALLMRKLKIQKTNSIVWHTEPDLPLENRKDITSVRKIIIVSLIIVGLSLQSNRKCPYAEEIGCL